MLILRAFFRLIDMVLFDNHNHSEFSFDGKRNSVEACARKALLKGLGGLAFTDHCDFFVPPMKAAYENLVPEVFDVEAQQKEIDRISDILTKECSGGSPLRILKGIEVGMHENHHDDIRKMLSEYSFDQVIASVHYLEDTDPFYGGYYEGKDWKRAYGNYLETIWKEMTWLRDFIRRHACDTRISAISSMRCSGSSYMKERPWKSTQRAIRHTKDVKSRSTSTSSNAIGRWAER